VTKRSLPVVFTSTAAAGVHTDVRIFIKLAGWTPAAAVLVKTTGKDRFVTGRCARVNKTVFTGSFHQHRGRRGPARQFDKDPYVGVMLSHIAQFSNGSGDQPLMNLISDKTTGGRAVIHVQRKKGRFSPAPRPPGSSPPV
jgi:hypothetical protein